MGVSTSISVIDGTTGVLNNIVSMLQSTITAFEGVQTASSDAFDAGELEIARSQLEDIQSQMRGLENATDNAESEQRDYNDSLIDATENANSFGKSIKSAIEAAVGIAAVKKGFDFLKDSMDAADVQASAETKLTTVMQERMGATDSMIQSVLELTSAQQKLGVVGDEVQISGAQQLATFLNSTSALNELIPAMNNLAVQQNGVNVSSENMASIANMMGKAMQGQASALTRVGISMSEAEKETIKNGNEMERAAALAEIITNNVGNMNEALASTPAGQMQQIKNDFGDMQEVLGQQLYPVVMNLMEVVQAHLPDIEIMMQALGSAAECVIEGVSAIIGVFDSLNISGQAVSSIIGGLITAFVTFKAVMLAYRAAVMVAAVAQKLLNGEMAISPIGVLAVAVGALIGTFFYLSQEFGSTQIAWMVLKDSFLTGIEYVKIGFAGMSVGVITAFNEIKLGAYTIGIGILNGVMGIALDITTIVEDCINMCIDMINDFIETINYLPFVEIDTISHITLGVCDDLRAGIAENKENIADYADEIESANDHLENGLSGMVRDIEYERQAREDEINRAIDEQNNSEPSDVTVELPQNDYTPVTLDEDDLNGTTKNIEENTRAIKDNLDITSDQLKYLREFAEEEAVNRFTSSNVHVEMVNNNTISSENDMETIVSRLKTRVEDEMAGMARGVH